MQYSITNQRYLMPDWPAPENVKALVTLRARENKKSGSGNFTSFNMSIASVSSREELTMVLENRALMMEDWQWKTGPQWLKEVQGTKVIHSKPGGSEEEGDAIWTDEQGLPCAILTADCLPVIFCNLSGTKVAAAHAGWRGLASGILEATVDALKDPPQQLMAWLGPAISQTHFEVGPEVRKAFMDVDVGAKAAFIPGNGDRWYGDLFTLARMRLKSKGLKELYGGGLCTFSDPQQWFSYRRDGPRKGNFATVVWLEDHRRKTICS